jgi:serine/threonine protein kinase/tetratricopeptide (TPR) repeat protein
MGDGKAMAASRNEALGSRLIPERWQKVKNVLSAALEIDPAERSSYLDRACDSDTSLRLEIEHLLAMEKQSLTAILNFSSSGFNESSDPASTRHERRVGPYQLVQEIGVGGMGEVYRALRADDQYRKEVAIKLVRAGYDSKFVVARFRNERQVLASLDHPNIARLLDGGTTDEGTPYFVMELLEGEALTEYCNQRRLAMPDRLELFLQVCSAVQYAHQRLIIHRDLKPSNILVTADGVPKLLDFGIAKILDPSVAELPDPTQTMFRLLTPAYASPEQIKGEPITTVSDVYSLGVVLYELLTGQHPYRSQNAAPEELIRAVCQAEPEKPSSVVCKKANARNGADSRRTAEPTSSSDNLNRKLRKQLRGDLDNIILMALRKEPHRRYASVEQFAADIRRHLENLPVIARKDTVRYRIAKFVARHKTGVLAAASVAALLLVALIVTLREARIARQQAMLAQQHRARAELRFNDVRKLANSLIFEIHDSIRDLPGATKARELLVERALEYLDSLSHESADPGLLRELATAYERIGDVQGNYTMANVSDFSGASASYAKAIAILESLSTASPHDANLRTALLQAYFRIFGALESSGDFDHDLRDLQKARSLVNTLSPGTGLGQQQFNMAGIDYYTARALEKTGNLSGALESYQQATSLLEPIASAPHAGMLVRAYYAVDQISVGKLLAELGRTKEGIAVATKALPALRKLVEDNPTNATFREQLANAYGLVADALQTSGDLAGALRLLDLENKILQELTSADPGNAMAEADRVWTELGIGEILLQQGKLARAGALIHPLLPMVPKVNRANTYWYAVQMAATYQDLGKLSAAFAERSVSPVTKRRHWTDASSWYQKALAVRSTGPGQLDSNGHDIVGEIQNQLATVAAALAQLRTSKLGAKH